MKHGKRAYEIVHDTNHKESTEYLQLSEIGALKPKPVIFLVKTIPENQITVSMHYEGLPYKVFRWFMDFAESYWQLPQDKRKRRSRRSSAQ